MTKDLFKVIVILIFSFGGIFLLPGWIALYVGGDSRWALGFVISLPLAMWICSLLMDYFVNDKS